MALVHTNITVTTSAKILVQMPNGVPYTAVQVFNNTGSTIYVGDSSITATGATVGNGITNGSSLQIWLSANDTLYAICASTPAGSVSVLYSGV
jgi:uncharacterized protein YcnI